MGRISGVNGIGRLTDIIVDEMPFDYLSKIKYVEMPNPMNRIKYIIEDFCGIPVDVEPASEFIYRRTITDKNTFL